MKSVRHKRRWFVVGGMLLLVLGFWFVGSLQDPVNGKWHMIAGGLRTDLHQVLHFSRDGSFHQAWSRSSTVWPSLDGEWERVGSVYHITNPKTVQKVKGILYSKPPPKEERSMYLIFWDEAPSAAAKFDVVLWKEDHTSYSVSWGRSLNGVKEWRPGFDAEAEFEDWMRDLVPSEDCYSYRVQLDTSAEPAHAESPVKVLVNEKNSLLWIGRGGPLSSDLHRTISIAVRISLWQRCHLWWDSQVDQFSP